MLAVDVNRSRRGFEGFETKLPNCHESDRGNTHEERLVFIQFARDAACNGNDLIGKIALCRRRIGVSFDSSFRLWPEAVAIQKVVRGIDLARQIVIALK